VIIISSVLLKGEAAELSTLEMAILKYPVSSTRDEIVNNKN
jgi:hypothetical protein